MNTIKICFVVLLCELVTRYAFAQTSNVTSVQTKTNTEKWGRATINLEARSTKEWNNFSAATGTSIFLKYHDRHYLLTARHVVENILTEDRLADMVMLIQNGSLINDKKNTDNELIMNLDAGTKMYLFSSKEHDLALINLDIRPGKEFVSTLLKRGYIPIDLSDIDLECNLKAGQEITCFGFPGDLYKVGAKPLTPEETYWKSGILSIPIISKGSVIDPLPNDYYFSGGIHVTHGNSGGPIVSNNKLVGIVSREVAELDLKDMPTFSYYRYRDLQFIKSSLIKELLVQLEDTVKWYEEIRK